MDARDFLKSDDKLAQNPAAGLNHVSLLQRNRRVQSEQFRVKQEVNKPDISSAATSRSEKNLV